MLSFFPSTKAQGGSMETLTAKDVVTKIEHLYGERNWMQFHSPKNLVMDLTSEVGELAELFRWLTEEESYIKEPKALDAVRDEIGDVLNTLLYLANRLGIDPLEAANQKLDKLALKYPVDKAHGKRIKYTHL